MKKRPTIGELIDPASVLKKEKSLGKPLPSERIKSAKRSDGIFANSNNKRIRTLQGVELYEGPSGLRGSNTRPLGTIIYNAEGDIVDTSLGAPIDLTKRFNGGNDVNVRNAIPEDAEELYSLGYNYIQSGDYELAEETFQDFIERFPDHLRIPDAHFWLGESHFSRRQYKKAAKVFLNSHRNWPDARLGPQTLLKLGVSMAGLNQRELACATYAEVGQKYPDTSAVIRRNVKAEQQSARCKVN